MRVTILAIAVTTLVVLGIAPRRAAADCNDWSDLRDEIATMLSGTARAELIAATNDIEYQESNGSDQDLLDAYRAWGNVLIHHMNPGGTGITEAQGATLDGHFIDASQANRFPVLGAGIQNGKACDEDFAQCWLTGHKCWTFEVWGYWGCASY